MQLDTCRCLHCLSTAYASTSVSMPYRFVIAGDLRLSVRLLAGKRKLSIGSHCAELCVVETTIDALAAEEVAVGALFLDTVRSDDNDAVGVLDRRQAVGDHQRRAAFREFEQRLLDVPLGFGVERRGRFVQNQNRRVLEEHSGDRQTLLLSTGEFDSPLADHRFDSEGQRGDQFVETRSMCRFVDFLV